MRSRAAIRPSTALVLATALWGLAPPLLAQTTTSPPVGAGSTPEPSSSLPPLPPAEPPPAPLPAPTTTTAPTTAWVPAPSTTSSATPSTTMTSWVPATPAPAPATAPKSRGNFELGARLGYGAPLGNVAKGEAMGDAFAYQVPVWFDVGYRFVSGIYVGMYLSYGFLKVKSFSPACPANFTDCTGTDVRTGLQLLYHAASDADVDPWFGIGFGREWLSYQATSATASRFGNLQAEVTVEGWNYLELQFGVDFQVAQKLGVGPFASFSMGKFTDVTTTVSGAFSETQSTPIASTSDHQWVTFGARGTFGGF